MSEITNRLPQKGLFLAILLVAGMVMTGFKPATENTFQKPDWEFFEVQCVDDIGAPIVLLPGGSGDLVNLKEITAKEIGKTVKLCKEYGNFIRVKPKSEGGGPIIIIG